MRIGFGYDIHKLVPGGSLVLGGVEIPFNKGLLGHSDADVLIHAVCDSILGAAGQGDLGEHFPDSDSRYKDISSMSLLSKIKNNILDKKKWDIVNIDVTVVMEEPNLSKYKLDISKNIANCLKIDIESINIKATTNEGIGEVGNNDAVISFCTVLIEKS